VNHRGTTSEGQGRHREVGSGGSLEQTCGPTNRNVVRGLVSRASWHQTAKPSDPGGKVNGAVVQGKRVLLSGEICSHGGSRNSREPDEDPSERRGADTQDAAGSRSARSLETAVVSGQKSAEAIVPAAPLRNAAGKGRTSRNKEEP